MALSLLLLKLCATQTLVSENPDKVKSTSPALIAVETKQVKSHTKIETKQVKSHTKIMEICKCFAFKKCKQKQATNFLWLIHYTQEALC